MSQYGETQIQGGENLKSMQSWGGVIVSPRMSGHPSVRIFGSGADIRNPWVDCLHIARHPLQFLGQNSFFFNIADIWRTEPDC